MATLADDIKHKAKKYLIMDYPKEPDTFQCSIAQVSVKASENTIVAASMLVLLNAAVKVMAAVLLEQNRSYLVCERDNLAMFLPVVNIGLGPVVS